MNARDTYNHEKSKESYNFIAELLKDFVPARCQSLLSRDPSFIHTLPTQYHIFKVVGRRSSSSLLNFGLITLSLLYTKDIPQLISFRYTIVMARFIIIVYLSTQRVEQGRYCG